MDTAPRDGTHVLAAVKVGITSPPMLTLVAWDKVNRKWLTAEGSYLSDNLFEGWAHLPDFELPPRQKTVIEEVEELKYFHTLDALDLYNDVLDILRKRKGEIIQ